MGFWTELKDVVLCELYSQGEAIASWWQHQVAQAEKYAEARRLNQAPATGDGAEFDRYDQLSMLDSSVRFYESRRIERLCMRYGIPIPARADRDAYEEFHDSGMVVLTTNGKDHLLNEIKTARKERSEAFRSWVLALSGLIGILIALISSLRDVWLCRL